MAKRKRLAGPFHEAMPDDLETKAHPFGRTLQVGPPIAHVAGDAAEIAALTELASEVMKARAEGRIVQTLRIDSIDVDHLVRDRVSVDAEEMDSLIESLRLHGQRMPVEVTNLGQGRFGLISGWRRLTALQRLQAETGEERFGHVMALLRKPAAAGDAYVAMVEENEIRAGLSYYERARIAARAVDTGVFASEREALQRLYAAASRAKRSKIGSFIVLYRAIGEALRFPAAIPERLGLELVKRIEADPDFAQGVTPDAATPEAELAALSRLVAPPKAARPALPEVAPGIRLAVKKGDLRLTGPGVDADFAARLEAWLRG